MGKYWRTMLAVAAGAAALAGCASPGDPIPADPVPDPGKPPTRATWVLGHRVRPTAGLEVVAKSVGPYDESTTVRLGPGPDRRDRECFVTLSALGQGGPDNQVGEKLPTTVQGRPGLRSGAGAEGDYLMWQTGAGTWVMASCDGDDRVAQTAAVAEAVELRTTSLSVPFDPGPLPEGYEISSVTQDIDAKTATVYLSTVQPSYDVDTSIGIFYEGADPLHLPGGRGITVAGRPAVLDDQPRDPEVCVAVQTRNVCVSSVSSDTGPYPDRTGQIPTLLDIAEGLRYAPDLEDLSTWFDAEQALG